MAKMPRRPGRRLAAAARIHDWSRTRLNEHWSDCQARAHAITQEIGLPDQPILGRLLFEIAIGPQESRAVTAYMLLGALPRLRVPLGEHVAELAVQHPDEVVRQRASRRLAGTLHGEYSDIADRWISHGSPDARERGFILAGAAGQVLSEQVVRDAIRNGSAGPAMYAAGMAGLPCLRALSVDVSLDVTVRGAAHWWLAQGCRIQS